MESIQLLVSLSAMSSLTVGCSSESANPGQKDRPAEETIRNDGNDQWRLEKRSALDGSLENCFGTGGAVVSNPSGGFDAVWDIALDGLSVVIVGEDQTPPSGDSAMLIEKRIR